MGHRTPGVEEKRIEAWEEGYGEVAELGVAAYRKAEWPLPGPRGLAVPCSIHRPPESLERNI